MQWIIYLDATSENMNLLISLREGQEVINFKGVYPIEQMSCVSCYIFHPEGGAKEHKVCEVFKTKVHPLRWLIFTVSPSVGVFCCGPASVKAILHGETAQVYDVPFVFAEVNADCVDWLVSDGAWAQLHQSGFHFIGLFLFVFYIVCVCAFRQCKEDGTMVKIWSDTKRVGQNISTKAVGSDKRLDITDTYKHKEGGFTWQTRNTQRLAVFALQQGLWKFTELLPLQDQTRKGRSSNMPAPETTPKRQRRKSPMKGQRRKSPMKGQRRKSPMKGQRRRVRMRWLRGMTKQMRPQEVLKKKPQTASLQSYYWPWNLKRYITEAAVPTVSH